MITTDKEVILERMGELLQADDLRAVIASVGFVRAMGWKKHELIGLPYRKVKAPGLFCIFLNDRPTDNFNAVALDELGLQMVHLYVAEGLPD